MKRFVLALALIAATIGGSTMMASTAEARPRVYVGGGYRGGGYYGGYRGGYRGGYYAPAYRNYGGGYYNSYRPYYGGYGGYRGGYGGYGYGGRPGVYIGF